ncbi:MAG: hypothetical protein C0P65_009445 [Lysobacteraceae bacterium]|jgi:hypothetical protein
MKLRTALAVATFALATTAAFPAPAADDQAGIRVLAEQSGLSEDQVRMVLRGRSYRDYRHPQRFDRAERRLVAAIGRDAYRRLTAGGTIVLERQGPDQAYACVASRYRAR